MSGLVARLRATGPRRPGRQCGAMSGAGYRCKLDFGHRQQHEWDRGPWPDFPALCSEAADEIERLEALAVCSYVFDCGCRCVLGSDHDGQHLRP